MKKRLLLNTTFLVCVAGAASADPITAALGVVLGGGATALAVAQVVVGLGLNIIGSALAKALAGKPKIDVNFEAQIGDSLPLSFIVGDWVTAGKRKYVGSWGPNTRYITEVFEISALPQPGVPTLWVNDEPGVVDWGTTTTITDKALTGRFLRTRSAYGGGGTYSTNTYTNVTVNLGSPVDNLKNGDTGYRLWIKWVDGSQTDPDPYLRGVFGNHPDHPYDANMIGKGKTYAIVTTQYDEDTATAVPSILFKPAPLRLYDPRKDTSVGGSGSHRWGDPATYEETRNNAVVAYNIARGIYYGSEWVFGGQNLAAWRLPLTEWAIAMNSCDALVPLAGGGTEPSYRCGSEISVDMEPLGVLEALGLTANMRFAEVGGRLKPIVGVPGASVFAFTDEDILVTTGQDTRPFAPMADTLNSITATYPEPEQRWKTKDAPETLLTNWLERDGQRLPANVNYATAPHPFQVQRLMRSQLLDAQRQILHEFSLPPVAYGLEPFDLLTWSSARNGYLAKVFMVEAVTKLAGMGVQVVLKEVDPADYDWSTDYQRPTATVPPTVVVPVYELVNSFTATGITVDDDTSHSRVAAIAVTCSGDIAGIVDLRIQARRLGATSATLDISRPFGAPYSWVATGVAPNTTYLVRVQPLSLYASGEWTDEVEVTTPDILVPLVGLAGDVTTAIDDAAADATAALTALEVLETDVSVRLAELTLRANAGLNGWVVDPVFADWTGDNLTAANWASRSGIAGGSGVEFTGAFGGGLYLNSVGVGAPDSYVYATNAVGLVGANLSAPFVVVSLLMEYISGAAGGVVRVGWSSDGTTWVYAAGGVNLASYGVTIKPGVRQYVERMFARPAGTFAYIRFEVVFKATGDGAQEQKWHLANIRAATEAEVRAGNVPGIQSAITTIQSTATTLAGTVATLDTRLSSSVAGLQRQPARFDFLDGDLNWAYNYNMTAALLKTVAGPLAAAPTKASLVNVSGLGNVININNNIVISERIVRPIIQGQRLRVRIRARILAGSSAGAFFLLFVRHTASGAYVDFGYNASTTFALAVADGWVTREVVIPVSDAFWATAGTAGFHLAISTPGATGANNIQFQYMDVDDVTDVTAVKATVDIHSATFVTLDSYAAATFAWRAVAGGAGASIEAVAADNPILGPASAVKIAAQYFEVTAESMRLSGGTGSALNLDPHMADASAWDRQSPPNIVAVADGKTGNAALRGISGADSHFASRPFNVVQGQKYRLRATGRKSVGSVGEYNYLRVYWYDVVGAFLSYDDGAYVLTTSWVEYSRSGIVPPAGAVFGRILIIAHYAGTAGYSDWQGAYFEPMIGTNLIVDGAITADQLSTGLLITDSAQIGSLVISGSAIIDGAVSKRIVQDVSGSPLYVLDSAGASGAAFTFTPTDYTFVGAITKNPTIVQINGRIANLCRSEGEGALMLQRRATGSSDPWVFVTGTFRRVAIDEVIGADFMATMTDNLGTMFDTLTSWEYRVNFTNNNNRLPFTVTSYTMIIQQLNR